MADFEVQLAGEIILETSSKLTQFNKFDVLNLLDGFLINDENSALNILHDAKFLI